MVDTETIADTKKLVWNNLEGEDEEKQGYMDYYDTANVGKVKEQVIITHITKIWNLHFQSMIENLSLY